MPEIASPNSNTTRDGTLKIYPQRLICSDECSHGDASRYGMFGDDKPSRLERGTVMGIFGLTLLSGGFRNGLVDCFGRDIECSRQSIDQPPSSMYVAGQQFIQAATPLGQIAVASPLHNILARQPKVTTSVLD